MTSLKPDLLIESLRFGYERGKPVVDGCDAALYSGRVTALVGPNAAGKSTLLRLMLGLERPWSGSVLLNGQRVDRLAADERARLLSYVPQRPGVRFAFTVRQVVAMGGKMRAGEVHECVDAVIASVGLEALGERVFSELSGGQQQQVMLARAELQASTGGRAVLLDEPGSQLDLHHRHAMMQRLRRMAEQGLAVLVVLHDLDLAVRYADDAWLMDQGRLVETGSWDQVLTPEKLEPVYRIALNRIDSGRTRPFLTVDQARGATMDE